MIGFWDYTVILTYVSFASAVMGIFCAISGHMEWSVFFLAFSGFCDMYDGKIARTKKNRTEDEKCFGIQIDSLCDMVCFGALPIIICYKIGMNHIYSIIILTLYGLAGLIRLAYFNVMEQKRQSKTNEDKSCYRGLPITSMAIALPLFFVSSQAFPNQKIFLIALHVLVAVIGLLFIVNFKFKKPSAPQIIIIVIIVAAAVFAIVFAEKIGWRMTHIFHYNRRPL